MPARKKQISKKPDVPHEIEPEFSELYLATLADVEARSGLTASDRAQIIGYVVAHQSMNKWRAMEKLQMQIFSRLAEAADATQTDRQAAYARAQQANGAAVKAGSQINAMARALKISPESRGAKAGKAAAAQSKSVGGSLADDLA